MRQNAIVIGVVVLVVTIMLFTGARKSRQAAGLPGQSQSQGLNAADVKGKMAPDFAVQDFSGKTIHLSDYRGKAVLLNFWATWCGPCKIEMPWFVELKKQYGDQGFEILGVAMDDSKSEDIVKFGKDMGLNYPIARGREELGDLYGGIPGLPTSVFIGRDGKIVDMIPGLVSRSDIEDDIRAALKENAPPASQAATASSTEKPAAAPNSLHPAKQGK